MKATILLVLEHQDDSNANASSDVNNKLLQHEQDMERWIRMNTRKERINNPLQLC